MSFFLTVEWRIKMLENLKQAVYDANMMLPEFNLVTFTWGNVSGIDREKKLIVIKPSGVEYKKLKPEDMVVVDFDMNVVEGNYRPSSDTATHIELYKAFSDIGGIVHTHSPYATSYAQALKPIPAYGTTHADYFYGTIPCTRILTEQEVKEGYEKNTGSVIVETFKNLDENAVCGVVVANHGPFSWGKDAKDAVHNAVVLEQAAFMGINTKILNENTKQIEQYILDKHYFRKHGKDAYYGQK